MLMSQVLSRSTLTPRRQPFLYLAAALVAGILIDRWIALHVAVLTGLMLLSAATCAMTLLRKRNATAAAALLTGFAAAGALLSSCERTNIPATRLQYLYDSKVINSDDPLELTGTLAAPPEPAPHAFYLDLAAEQLRVRGQWMPASGRARLVISTPHADAKAAFARLGLDYGSRIRTLVRLERARAYYNPGSPDFNEFLERRGYDLTGVIKSPLLIERLGAGPANPLLSILYRMRMRIIDALDSSFNPRVGGTLKAMLTDNRYYLDRTTVERLRESSTFHTLSISGLHIGIIAWALLGGPSVPRRRKAWRVIICLLALWAYATMVGLAPPVTRATTMITAGLIAPLLFRRSASINTVSIAAFIMLALKPALVADPGFQLSFVAVAAIVALALPVANKLRQIGQWRPTSQTPHPPSCSPTVRFFAETLFWDDQAFEKEMRNSPVRYRLKKARAASVVGRLYLQPILRSIALLLITSGSIQLATLPLMAFYFNLVTPVGVLLNVVAGLLTGVLMLTAIVAIVVRGLSPWLTTQLGAIVNAAHYLLVNAITPFAAIPFATFRVAHYEGGYAVIYALYIVPLAMVAVMIDWWRPVDHLTPVDRIAIRRVSAIASSNPIGSQRRVVVATFAWMLAMTAVLLAVLRPPSNQPDGRLRVHFLDVGQGDSALVVFPRGKTMLLDGGGELRFTRREQSETEPVLTENAFSIGDAVVSRFIWSLGRTKVDYVLATHADADHMGGLSDVVENFRIGQAIVGHVPSYDLEYQRFAESLRRRQAPLSAVSGGEHFEIDGVRVEVLWPPKASGAAVTSGNDDSVVLRLVYGSVSMLFAGDIERAAEASLVASGVDLRADLLKVPHHGSRTSSTEAFVNAVNPRYAVISVGERSRFGHPHAAVVERYRARNTRLLQTGRQGTVTAATDGVAMEVSTYRK